LETVQNRVASAFQTTLDSLSRISLSLPQTDTDHSDSLADLSSGLHDRLTCASNTMIDTLNQIESTLHSTSRSGITTLLSDLRQTGSQLDQLIQNVTLRIQQRINQSVAQIPGTFPPRPTSLVECENALIEMGYFTVEDLELAKCLSDAVHGDLLEAIEIMEQTTSLCDEYSR